MNDFTKDELQELHAALSDRHENIEDFVPVQPLRIKIQSLIDRYCEHDTYESMGGVRECIKCGRVWA